MLHADAVLTPRQRLQLARREQTVARYEHAAPGDLLHADVKKLGNIPAGGGWRILGRAQGKANRIADGGRARSRHHHEFMRHGFIHVVLDDHSRLAYLRLAKLLALRIGDIDIDATLAVRRQVVETDAGPVESSPKAGSQRVVHLPAGVSALAEHLKTRSPALPTARLLVRRDGRVFRAHNVHAAWSTARRAADLPDVHVHALRHAGLTLTAQSGATLAQVMRRAGHSLSRAAMIYRHAAERRDAARLGRLAAGTTPPCTGT